MLRLRGDGHAMRRELLSAGALSGVVAAGVVAVLVLGLLALFLYRRAHNPDKELREGEHHFYVCHSSGSVLERGKAESLTQWLATKSFKVSPLSTGEDELVVRQQAIESCKCFVLLLTEGVFTDEGVVEELDFAINEDLPIILVGDVSFDADSLSFAPSATLGFQIGVENLLEVASILDFEPGSLGSTVLEIESCYRERTKLKASMANHRRTTLAVKAPSSPRQTLRTTEVASFKPGNISPRHSDTDSDSDTESVSDSE